MLAGWEETAAGALALLILTDQFARNIWRGSAHAFATDPLARSVADRAIARGFDMAFAPELRQFFYLPFQHHEDAGSAFLANHFGPEVVDPVRLHVAAKRYLCTVEPEYGAALSPASRLSLELHGGPMSAAEVQAFEREPHFQAAVACRRWDDDAKEPDLRVPGLEAYRPLLLRHCRSAA